MWNTRGINDLIFIFGVTIAQNLTFHVAGP